MTLEPTEQSANELPRDLDRAMAVIEDKVLGIAHEAGCAKDAENLLEQIRQMAHDAAEGRRK